MPSPEVLEALQELHKELNKLEPAIKHVETAIEVTKIVKDIPDKHLELINTLKKVDLDLKKNLEIIFREKLEEIRKENVATLEKIGALVGELKEYQKYLTDLRNQIEAYYIKIDKINFPERLDKIDNGISAIVSGIKNLQTRINDSERHIVNLVEDNGQRHKRGNIINLVFFILILLALISIIYKLSLL